MSRVLSRALCRAATLSAGLTGVTVLAASAVAQQAPASDGAEGQREPAVPVAGNAAGASVEPSEAPLAVASDVEDDAAKYRRFDALAEPGLTTSVPGSADSLLRDAGGVRSMLAEHDIGIQARLSMVGLYNPLDTGQPYAPQRYNGQRPTLQYQATNIVTTIGLDKFGLADAKLILGYNSQITTFRPNGQNTVGFRNIALYQSFADNKIELKLGIMPNYYEWVGFFVGGSPVLASGLTGLIPIQAGLSADPAATPAVNLTFHAKRGGYLKLGVQRSTAPAGTPYELDHNGPNVAFKMKDAGPLYIGEVGVKRPASKDGKQIWVRAGALYNDSNYTRFDGQGTAANKTVYGAADFQLTQPDRAQPSHGVYAGASVFWAPSNVNSMTQFYEGRVYHLGPFASRPLDSVALRVGYTKYSDDAQTANAAQQIYANDHQFSVTGSYTFHATHGLYLTPGVAYIKNPSFIGRFKDALNLSGTIYVLL